jgi:ankyrin repeat protein
MGAQNAAGNTVLHYTVAYGFEDLTRYLITKGAKDDVLNADGLTCYEGLSNAKGTIMD